jgi:hypothetical protein
MKQPSESRSVMVDRQAVLMVVDRVVWEANA